MIPGNGTAFGFNAINAISPAASGAKSITIANTDILIVNSWLDPTA
jgi:hypothetical protein